MLTEIIEGSVRGVEGIRAAELANTDGQALSDRFTVQTGGLGGLADLRGEDVGWVYLSNMAYRGLLSESDSLREKYESDESRGVMTRQEFEFEVSRRLYGDRRFLGLVLNAMDARGGFVSPLVRHFTAFYVKVLRERVKALSDDADPSSLFWEERLESIIGRAEAEATSTLPHHQLTIIGDVVAGRISADRDDPDRMNRAYRVDEESVRSKVVLREVLSRTARVFLKGYVRMHFRHLVKEVRFIDQPVGSVGI